MPQNGVKQLLRNEIKSFDKLIDGDTIVSSKCVFSQGIQRFLHLNLFMAHFFLIQLLHGLKEKNGDKTHYENDSQR